MPYRTAAPHDHGEPPARAPLPDGDLLAVYAITWLVALGSVTVALGRGGCGVGSTVCLLLVIGLPLSLRAALRALVGRLRARWRTRAGSNGT